MSGVSHHSVTAAEDGQQLGRWIKKNYPALPQSLIQKVLRTGQMRINGKRVKINARLAEGDDIRIPPLGEGANQKTIKPSEKDVDTIRNMVLYEDAEIIALNKPSGLATQGGTKISKHIDFYLQAFAKGGKVAPKLVHRLDKATSGVLVVAKNLKVAQRLGRAFQGREVSKIYLAIVCGGPEDEAGTITAPLDNAFGKGKSMEVAEAGKRAITHFQVIDRVGQEATLMAFKPVTGRKHQIRVHAAYAGWPILGDQKYGGTSEALEALVEGERLFLHAFQIRWDGLSARNKTLQAPLPKDFTDVLKTLGLVAKPDKDILEELHELS